MGNVLNQRRAEDDRLVSGNGGEPRSVMERTQSEEVTVVVCNYPLEQQAVNERVDRNGRQMNGAGSDSHERSLIKQIDKPESDDRRRGAVILSFNE